MLGASNSGMVRAETRKGEFMRAREGRKTVGKAERGAGDDAVSGDSFDGGGRNSEFDLGVLVSKENE